MVIEELHPARRSMRIAMVTETYPPEVNGVAMTIARFAEGLRERGNEVQLIRPRQSAIDEAPGDDIATGMQQMLVRGMPIPRYPHLKLGLPAKKALVRQWSLRRPDIVHIVTEGPLGWSALKAANHLKLPVSSDFRTNFHSYSGHYGVGWLRRPILAYLRKFHNRTDLTLVPTTKLRDELAALGFRNLEVVARGVDTQLFSPIRRSTRLRAQWGADDKAPIALYVGRLAPEKNLSTVLRAFNAIRAKCPAARLVIVGDGPDRQALEQQMPDAIFAGMRYGEDLAAHYASGDLFLFPSLTETFGNVTLEAMASGLAVVAFDHAAAGQLIDHGHNGLLATPGEVDEFSELAVSLATSAQATEPLRAAARQSAESRGWSRIVGQFESQLANVIEPGTVQ